MIREMVVPEVWTKVGLFTNFEASYLFHKGVGWP